MSSLALQLDATLKTLDAPTALRLNRAVQGCIALATPSPLPVMDAKGFPIGYFDETAGAFADIEFERPPQGELPVTVEW